MNSIDSKHLPGTGNSIPDSKMFFISGAPKSGTTWLQKALDAHPEIACSGEGHFFNGFGEFLKRAANLYNEQMLDPIAKEAYQGSPYYEKLRDEDIDILLATFVRLMLGKRKDKKKAMLFGDKTPANAIYMNTIHRVFPKAKFIHIYRDGRDLVVSSYKAALRIHGSCKTFRDSISIMTKKWVHYNKAALEFGKKSGGIFFPVAYEDLANDFPKHFSSILRFLGADDSENIVNNCAELASFEKLSGGRKRGEENTDSFYRKGIVGDWKNIFSDKDLDLFYSIGGDMLKELGYNK